MVYFSDDELMMMMIYFSGASLPRLSWKKAVQRML